MMLRQALRPSGPVLKMGLLRTSTCRRGDTTYRVFHCQVRLRRVPRYLLRLPRTFSMTYRVTSVIPAGTRSGLTGSTTDRCNRLWMVDLERAVDHRLAEQGTFSAAIIHNAFMEAAFELDWVMEVFLTGATVDAHSVWLPPPGGWHGHEMPGYDPMTSWAELSDSDEEDDY